MKPQKFFPLLLAVGLFLLVLGLLLLFRYAQARGSMMVLAFVFGTCDPSEMIFFLGMPLWWTGGVIVYLAMFIIGMVHLKKSKTYSMLPREPKEEVTEK